MRNGLPISYSWYRSLWSVAHLGLVGFMVIVMAIWFIHDHEGVHLVALVWGRLINTQHSLANSIRFPWSPRR